MLLDAIIFLINNIKYLQPAGQIYLKTLFSANFTNCGMC